MRCNPNHGRSRVGFTLAEILVVIAIISIMSVTIVAEMHGTFQDALLRSTSRELISAFNLASSRAIAINRPHRIHFDTVEHRYLLERSTRRGMEYFPVQDVSGNVGKLDSRISITLLEPGVSSPDDAGDEPPTESPTPSAFPSMGAEDAVTFYPDGTADARNIELADRDGYRLELRISPVTSRVQITAIQPP